MKKLAKFIVAATLTTTMAMGILGMAACTDGKDGATPEIKNGNWWIGDTDTGVKAEGTQGTQGVGIKNVSINEEGKLVITLSNDEVITLGKVTGADGVDGEDGQDGKGVKKFEINAEGKLVVTYSDDTTEVLDKVVGENGAAGNSIVGAEIDSDGNLILKMNEGGDITAGNVKGEQGIGIQSIEIKDGQFEITLTNGEVIHLDIPGIASEKHTHNWNKSKEHEATCTSIGYIVYTCDVDGCDDEKYEFTEAHGHNYKNTPSYTIPATCIKEGLEIYNCEVCGDVKTEVTKTIAHNYQDGTCTVCGDVESTNDSVKDFGAVTISANGTFDLDLTGVEAGTYYLVAETSEAAASAILSSVTDDSANHNGSANYIFTCDMYAAIKGEYKSAVIINDGTKLSLKNSSSSEMVANVKLVELTVPTIEEGVELDIPAMNMNNGYVEIPVSENLIGKTVRITIKNSSVTPAVLDSAKKTLGAWKATDKQADGSYQKEFTLSATCTSLYFRNSSSTYSNLVVLFEVVG